MHKLGAVIRFTFMNSFKRKSFLISTVIMVVILTLLIQLPGMIERYFSDNERKIIGFVGGEESVVLPYMQSYFGAESEPSLELVPVASEEEARERVEDKELTGYLVATDETNVNGIPVYQYKSKNVIPDEINDLSGALQFANQLIARENVGLTDEQAAKLFAPVQIEPVQLTGAAAGGKSESEIQLAYILVYALLILLYVGVVAYGNTVATEITAEKSSRVMELLVSSVSPLTQMFGKIIGICLLGLTQMLVLVTAGILNLAMGGHSSFFANLNLAEIDPMLIVYFFVFYLLGYFIYAALFAAAGSLVSRSEEVAQVITPVTFLIVFVFFLAMFGLMNPNAPLIVAMSYIPFFSPMLMFLRIGMTDPQPWEIILSIALSAAGIYAIGWMAAKIYRTGVLMYGKLPTWKELRKAMKAYDV